MSALDKYHNCLKAALIQEGWTITHDPYRLSFGRRRGYIDLAAEMPIAAERDGRRIAVNVRLIFFDPHQERILKWIDVIPTEIL